MTPTDCANCESDEALLTEFVQSGSEAAFQSLVEKHLNMVLGVAARRLGHRGSAEDVAQNVFTALARKASRLKASPTLAGWLYRVTMLECAEVLRQEHSRGQKMKQISEQVLLATEGESVWREALPLLDEVIAALPSVDRDMVVLRFFERMSFREIGASMGKSEAAAQKQTRRALQKISSALGRKGVVISAALLSSNLTATTATATSTGLVQTISQGALTTASDIGAKSLILKTIEAMTYAKTKTMAVAAAVISVPLLIQWNANREVEAKLSHINVPPAPVRAVPIDSPTPSKQSETVTAAIESPVINEEIQRVLTPHEVARQWELALFEPDPLERGKRIHALLASLTATSAPAVAEAFTRAQDSGMGFKSDYRLFLRRWGNLDGAAAVQQAIGSDDKVTGSAEVLAALAGWASTVPADALTWVNSLPEGRNKENVVYGLLDGWSLTDLRSAAAYAESRPRSPARERFRKLLLERSLMAGGTSAAQSWFHNIPDDEHNSLYKQRAFDEVIQAMLYRDPSSAAQWISQLDGRPYLVGKSVAKTAAKMAETAPKATLDWLLTLEGMHSKQAATALGHTVGAWSKKNPGDAGTWLRQNDQHPQYNSMADQFARGIAEADPSTALQWAQSIPDDKLRSQSELAVARIVVKVQGDDSTATLTAAGLTAKQIAAAKQGARYNSGLTYLVANQGALGGFELTQAGAQDLDLYTTTHLKKLESEVELLNASAVMALEWDYLLQDEQRKER